MSNRQHDIERTLVGMVKRSGGLCLRWVCPGWTGIPSRIILLPGGRIIFADTRRPKNADEAERGQYWRQKLRSLGFSVWKVHDWETVSAVEMLVKQLNVKR